ncbi:hypothetical protein BATDEDRAFT_23666 [Batrachochytrium dendrobatidis JAM81]|uniref:AAA+ ATPase domain-containing protein n=1 Tax=Batrachochytrium dendrobatidis (strain JAM81 / FGSC 10211) TaxID=684364 RepID=F4NXZ7_BATDJ|nr:uncharacterized protein BATDEDRAFT_23666 [Batrachochytrium dendrobatidis JAM81]EGF81929.1 hypothetical protein BATDEDRAFT_23666 [Batrachochytrium dendrobatidis JAM81]|eukprot:XP_006677344.1 hypothetical protein BATDEDRAFT_23666 [Batrachochytrium dendrobatidis JAM81]
MSRGQCDLFKSSEDSDDSFILLSASLQKTPTAAGFGPFVRVTIKQNHILNQTAYITIPVYVRYVPDSIIPTTNPDDLVVSEYLASMLWLDGQRPSIHDPIDVIVEKLEGSDILTARAVTLKLVDFMNCTRYQFLNDNTSLLSLKLSGKLLCKGMTFSLDWLDGKTIRFIVENIAALASQSLDNQSVVDSELISVCMCCTSASTLFTVLPRTPSSLAFFPPPEKIVESKSPPWFPGLEPAFNALSKTINCILFSMGDPAYPPTKQADSDMDQITSFTNIRGLLVAGVAGSGKSCLVRGFVEQMGIPWSVIDAIQLISSRSVPIENVFQALFDQNVPRPKGLNRSCSSEGTLLILITNDEEQVKKRLGAAAIYFEDFKMPTLTIADRSALFQAYIKDIEHGETQILALSKQTKSHALSDLVSALQKSMLKYGAGQDRLNELCEILKNTPPSGLRGIASKLPETQLSDLFGIQNDIDRLNNILIRPFRDYNQDLANDSILTVWPPHGILIYGPHGVGKTKLACALANELAFPCIFVNIEHLLTTRSEHSSSEGTSNRIVTSFLTELDGVTKHTAPICIVATSQTTKTIDPAVLRPGRIGIHVKLTLPNRSSRLDMFNGVLQQMPCDIAVEDIDIAVDRTQGMSFSDISGICREAAMIAIRTGASTVVFKHISSAIDAMANSD